MINWITVIIGSIVGLIIVIGLIEFLKGVIGTAMVAPIMLAIGAVLLTIGLGIILGEGNE